MAKFSEIYVESKGKLYKFEDAEIMVAEENPEDVLVQEQQISADQQDAQEQVAQTVGVAQAPAVEETAQVAQAPVCDQTVQTGASSSAAASAAQMVAETVIAPVATAAPVETAPVAEVPAEEKDQTVQEQFNELYESLI